MGENNEQEVKNEQKIQTRYDRKMEQRKKQAEKDAKNDKIIKIVSIVIIAAILVAIVSSFVISVIDKKQATQDTYISVGEHEVTKLEYDYFFNSTVNNYISTYGSFLSYMGLNTAVAYDKQQYSETMTWQDMFDQMTVEQIKQIKALGDDAGANGYTYDSTEEYKTVLETVKTGAKDANVSLDRYAKATYGSYATIKNVEPFMKENILINAYYKELIEKNAPTDQEVKEYYAENKETIDRINYRSFLFNSTLAAEATEEDLEKEYAELTKKANAMVEERKAGKEFKELCLTNATAEQKASYEDPEADPSLMEAMQSASIPAAVSPWLLEDGRVEGDITVIENKDSNQVYVIEFTSRYFDEADNETISNTISTTRVSEYVAGLYENYTVTDVKGKLKYLTLEETLTPAASEEVPVIEETTGEAVTEETTGEAVTEESIVPETTETTETTEEVVEGEEPEADVVE